MKHDLLSRYDQDTDGHYIINTRVNNCNSLFSEFDFASSLWNRDLREEFVDYLVESADEIGTRNKFLLQLRLPENEKEEGFTGKFSKAITSYFLYLIHISRKSIKKIVNKIIINFVISISFLILIFFTGKTMENSDSMLYMIYNEGLSIAIWVLMWPVFSEFLLNIKEELNKIRTYKRLQNVKLLIKYY